MSRPYTALHRGGRNVFALHIGTCYSAASYTIGLAYTGAARNRIPGSNSVKRPRTPANAPPGKRLAVVDRTICRCNASQRAIDPGEGKSFHGGDESWSGTSLA